MTLEQIKHRIFYGTFDESNFDIDHDKKLTMLPEITFNNIEYCLKECINNNIEGDFIETGVWRGGASIWAYHLLKKLDNTRKVYVYDSFEGCPIPNPTEYPADYGDNHHMIDHLAVSLEKVQENFKLFGDIDDNVIFVKGWFKDTMPINNINKLSVLRLDGDLYESTIQVLDALYPKLSPGGFCIIDDWCVPGAKQATYDYRTKYNIEDPIETIGLSAFWKKS